MSWAFIGGWAISMGPGETFSIGDPVEVILDRVDAVERKLTFSLVPTDTRKKK